MNKGIVIGIIIAVAIAIGFGILMTNDDTIQPTEIEENPTETEETTTPKSYSVQLEESVGIEAP